MYSCNVVYVVLVCWYCGPRHTNGRYCGSCFTIYGGCFSSIVRHYHYYLFNHIKILVFGQAYVSNCSELLHSTSTVNRKKWWRWLWQRWCCHHRCCCSRHQEVNAINARLRMKAVKFIEMFAQSWIEWSVKAQAIATKQTEIQFELIHQQNRKNFEMECFICIRNWFRASGEKKKNSICVDTFSIVRLAPR